MRFEGEPAFHFRRFENHEQRGEKFDVIILAVGGWFAERAKIFHRIFDGVHRIADDESAERAAHDGDEFARQGRENSDH